MYLLRKLRQPLIADSMLIHTAVMVFWGIVLAILMRIFLFMSFSIPSMSMYPTLIPGDFIVVNKFVPGPRIWLPFMDGKPKPFFRVPGWKALARNEVVVFNPPNPKLPKGTFNTNTYLVKRSIGIPGDTVEIVNGRYLINSTISSPQRSNQEILSNMTPEQVKKTGVLYESFPWDTVNYGWNIKDFGPLYVPRSGEKITVSIYNIALYKDAIEFDSGETLTVRGTQIQLGDRYVNSYIFIHDFYFMGGDYVQDSNDSRYWGLVSDELVVGKAMFILTSKDPATGTNIYDRWIKAID